MKPVPAPSRPANPRSARWHIWAAGGALAALVAAVYWPTWNNGLVSDDEFYIVGVEKLASLDGLRDIWFKLGCTPQYYPLVHTALWFEYQIWGPDPQGYHAMNWLLHAGVAVLLWRLLVRLQVPGAWLAAAIFAVHPVEVESVAWASERKNVMSALFALGALLAYLRFSPPEMAVGAAAKSSARSAPTTSWWNYVLAFVLYLAALGCKTVTVSTPAVLLVIYGWKRGRIDRREVLRLTPFFAVGVALSLVTVWMEKQVVGAVGPEWNFSPIDRLLIAGRALWFYAAKIVWPHPLTFTYPRWTIDSTAAWQYVYPAAALALVAGLWLARHKVGRGPLAAVLIFGGVLVPAIGFFDVYPFLFSFVADHYQYHASMSLIALATAGAALTARRLGVSWRWPARMAAAAVLLALAVVAHRETDDYLDNETLIRDNVAGSPTAWAGHDHLGTHLAGQGRHQEAIEAYREALRLFPLRAQLHIRIGVSLGALARNDEAIESFRRAVAGPLADEDRQTAHLYLANLLGSQGEYDEAIANYRASIRLRPDAQAMYNCALALRAKGDLTAAISLLKQSVGLQPGRADGQHALGILLGEAGRTAEAIAPLAAAARLAPNDAQYCEDLAVAQLKAGDLGPAEQALRRALRLRPRSASAHNLLGAIQGQRGHLDAAITAFQAALAIDPQHAGAQANLQAASEAKRQAAQPK
jgi:tetratricopeptide (TPR) repeat protein